MASVKSRSSPRCSITLGKPLENSFFSFFGILSLMFVCGFFFSSILTLTHIHYRGSAFFCCKDPSFSHSLRSDTRRGDASGRHTTGHARQHCGRRGCVCERERERESGLRRHVCRVSFMPNHAGFGCNIGMSASTPPHAVKHWHARSEH